MPIFNEKFILNAPKKFSNLLTVKCAGITNEDSNYFISRSESDSIIIEYVLFGKGYIEVENKKYSLYKGDCFVLQSNQAHKYYADKKSPFKKVFFSFNGDFITVLLKLYNLTENPIIAPIADKKPFEQLLYLLSNNINDKNIEGVLCLKLHEIILQVKN
ncbi:MAG: AraC family ligand binding domain-containing protein, partial [Clostridia bacterium]